MLGIIFEPTCSGCYKPIEYKNNGILCPDCYEKLESLQIDEPTCIGCATPLHPSVKTKRCVACLIKPYIFKEATSYYSYDGVVQILINQWKNLPKEGMSTFFERLFIDSILKRPPKIRLKSLVVPIPSHPKRFKERHFDPAWKLSKAASKALDTRLIPALLRIKHTNHQTGLTLSQRARNISGAFSISPKWEHHISGKFVHIVDDVFTTGATLNEATKTLLRANPTLISVITLTRTIR